MRGFVASPPVPVNVVPDEDEMLIDPPMPEVVAPPLAVVPPPAPPPPVVNLAPPPPAVQSRPAAIIRSPANAAATFVETRIQLLLWLRQHLRKPGRCPINSWQK
jgi:hypothetical protein